MMVCMQIRGAQINSSDMKSLKIRYQWLFSSFKGRGLTLPCTGILLLTALTISAQPQYLKRSTISAAEVKMAISTGTAHYSPLFGAGDDSSKIIRGLERFGRLNIDPGGNSNFVTLPGGEQVFFVLEGTGILEYGNEKIPVSRNDFIYMPSGMKSRFANPRERALSVLLMGFIIQPENKVKPSAGMMIANADEVPFQILGSHGPTTQFQLLMGTSESTRDKLAAACQVTSLFIMDFAAGGTNIPHRHDREEEIYLILRGQGDIVAGEYDGKERRHPSKQGDAYFFSPKTLIGFYSGNKEGEEHARILAVRFTYP
jgi:mannose-6-phosphate isomerase-like protein (cupin superfamily)